jgi:hypothetical protein
MAPLEYLSEFIWFIISVSAVPKLSTRPNRTTIMAGSYPDPIRLKNIVGWSSFRGYGINRNRPQCPRFQEFHPPLSSRVNLELALCCRPAHHGQAQYGLPRNTDDGTLISHPQYPQRGYVRGPPGGTIARATPLRTYPGTGRMSTSNAELHIWRPPGATFGTSPTRKAQIESSTSHWSATTLWI